MKKALLLFFCLSAKILLAQTDIENNDFIALCSEKDTNKAIVIAISGLKIREQPNPTSKVISVVPYGKKLTRLTRNQDFYNQEVISDSIVGYWDLVQYKKIKGYVFKAFCAEGIIEDNEKYYLILENNGFCQSDYYGSPLKINYYVALFSPDSTATTLQKIIPMFSLYNNEFGGGTRLDCPDQRASSFILATKSKMKECKIENATSYNKILFKRGNSNYKIVDNNLPNSSFYFEMKIEKFIHENSGEEFENFSMYLKDTKTGKTQRIVSNINPEVIKLIWKGDLDNDGKDDFLLDFEGTEDDNFLQLYLTKGTKQIVIPSSKYYLIDCC